MEELVNIFKKDYIFNQNIVYRNMGETMMAYNEERAEMYELNDISGIIFQKLNEGTSLQNLLIELSTMFNISEDEIREDVEELLNRFISIDIITLVD